MLVSAHTSDPWKLVPNDGAYVRKDYFSTLRIETDMNNGSTRDLCIALIITDTEELAGGMGEANGRLMALAPNMYRALRQLVAYQESTDLDDETEDGEYGDGKRALIAAREVIAKVVGNQFKGE